MEIDDGDDERVMFDQDNDVTQELEGIFLTTSYQMMHTIQVQWRKMVLTHKNWIGNMRMFPMVGFRNNIIDILEQVHHFVTTLPTNSAPL